MLPSLTPSRAERLLGPLLASLPAAAVSTQPPTALLPLLSPILRQRVQLLAGAGPEAWLSLLCYDSSKTSLLQKAARNERLEPHPVSGEIELDWETELTIIYRRVDKETLQALATLLDLGISVQLVWCVNDEVGGEDGWRIGEVGILDKPDITWGQTSIAEAEVSFAKSQAQQITILTSSQPLYVPEEEDDDDDDDYWAQYDKTPGGHTPAPKEDTAASTPLTSAESTRADEDSYYAKYESVQPALDNHDPDEAQQNGEIETTLGRDEITRELQQNLSPTLHSELSDGSMAWLEPLSHIKAIEMDGLAQPRPSSSSVSSGSDTVARLEKKAEGREQSEVGIKQHIGTSVKSLFRLARAAGIERHEFNRLIRTELECLELMDQDD
jgi:hypothetical protein